MIEKQRKEKKITNSMQEVAVDILMRLFTKGNETIVSDVCRDYKLMKDPFTKLPCTTKEYYKLLEEYSKQKMTERFGYYE